MRPTNSNDSTNNVHANHFFTVQTLTLIGVCTAIICILGPLSIPFPFSPVPISLTHLGIYTALYALGWKKGTLSYLIYLLAGLCGLPVFSAFTGGPGKLFGPTGGYFIGFLFMAVICGLFIDRFPTKPLLTLPGFLLGNIACYAFGTLWLSLQANISFSAALAAGVLPFIPGDLIKVLLVFLIGPVLRKRLIKAGFFLPNP
jgi:biotin transport system substrate-specific component